MADLLRDQESFLRALQEHLDDCYLVLKTLVDPSRATKNPLFAEKYVTENRLPGAKTFHSAIVDYKTTLRIANKLKHQQGRLRGVALWLPDGAHLGYFLEEPDALGQIGPSPDLHPDQGCFSFARDLTWHLFNIYACSEKLLTAIGTAVSALHGTKLSTKPTTGDKTWDHVVDLACSIPQAFFPKEVPKHAAIFWRHDGGRKLTTRYPQQIRLTFPSAISASCSTVVDGHAAAHKVPFP
jgi:hypothetical protein